MDLPLVFDGHDQLPEDQISDESTSGPAPAKKRKVGAKSKSSHKKASSRKVRSTNISFKDISTTPLNHLKHFLALAEPVQANIAFLDELSPLQVRKGFYGYFRKTGSSKLPGYLALKHTQTQVWLISQCQACSGSSDTSLAGLGFQAIIP